MTQAKERTQAQYEAPTPKYLWHSGEIIPWEEATVHITQIGWTAISAVFEGIRGYWSQEQGQTYLFRLDEHLKRLASSMKLMRMEPRFSSEEVTQAIVQLIRASDYKEDVYIQPLAYFSGSIPGYHPAANRPSELLITARPAQSNLGTERGSHCCVSSWVRISDNAMPPRVKALANYQNNRLVSTEARINGYDSGIILNDGGKVAEGAYSCIFLVKDGAAVTPDVTSGILEGITRASVMKLLREDMGLEVREREVDRTELYVADEIFLCGTLAEIEPVLSVDRYTIGEGASGPVTSRLERLYHTIVRGQHEGHSRLWCTPVY
ncbi:MAG: branched-chain amino acid aminotransferase [Dehalococcoidia bacterium]|nr:branched-chain amino acid aminotransferase [Dehalococcoidia bacterium]